MHELPKQGLLNNGQPEPITHYIEQFPFIKHPLSKNTLESVKDPLENEKDTCPMKWLLLSALITDHCNN